MNPKSSETAAAILESGLEHLPSGPRERLVRSRARGLTQRERIFDLHVCQALPLLQVARTLGLSLKLVSYHWCRLQKEIIANAPRSPDDFAVMRERIGAMLWDAVRITCAAPCAEVSSSVHRPSLSLEPTLEVHPSLKLRKNRRRTGRATKETSKDATKDEAEVREGAAAAVPAGADGGTGGGGSVAVPTPATTSTSTPIPAMLAIRLRALEQLAKLYDLTHEPRATALAPVPYATPEEVAASVRERMLEWRGLKE